MGLLKDDYRFLRLLELSPFELRAGGWRFGTKRICQCTVERLIASGAVVVEGARLRRVKLEGRRS